MGHLERSNLCRRINYSNGCGRIGLEGDLHQNRWHRERPHGHFNARAHTHTEKLLVATTPAQVFFLDGSRSLAGRGPPAGPLPPTSLRPLQFVVNICFSVCPSVLRVDMLRARWHSRSQSGPEGLSIFITLGAGEASQPKPAGLHLELLLCLVSLAKRGTEKQVAFSLALTNNKHVLNEIMTKLQYFN